MLPFGAPRGAHDSKWSVFCTKLADLMHNAFYNLYKKAGRTSHKRELGNFWHFFLKTISSKVSEKKSQPYAFV